MPMGIRVFCALYIEVLFLPIVVFACDGLVCRSL